VKIATIAGLALALSACGGASEEPAAPTVDESASSAAAPETVAAPESVAASEPEASEAAEGGSAASGEAPIAFTQCKACHSVEPGKHGIGPSLAGIYGTKAADIADYQFSPAMQKSGLTWDDATLDAYLESPQKLVPGTKMSFFGIKDAAKRKEVIEYIKTLK
jgi:cytochrome c